MKKTIFLTIFTIVAYMPFSAYATKTYTVTEVAQYVADGMNKEFSKTSLDEDMVSVTAKAKGKNITVTYVLSRMDFTDSEKKEFKNSLIEEILPPVCNVNKDTKAFQKGLSYTYIYTNRYNESLATIEINRNTCKNVSH